MSSTTYLTVVNDAIKEAGVDLASFDVAGTDWTSNTNAMMQRFKGWVARSWQDIQQNAYDLEFMEEIAVVNINPGVMFYTNGTAISTFTSIENTSIDMFDQDASTAIPQIPVSTVVDLTGEFTSTDPFGYFNVVANGTSQISWALKPAAEYFLCDKTITYTNIVAIHGFVPSSFVSYTQNIPDSNIPCVVNLNVNGTIYTGLAALSASTDSHIEISCSAAIASAIVTNNGLLTISDPQTNTSNVLDMSQGTFTINNLSISNPVVVHPRGYVHGWKSFDFEEELGLPGFLETIQEIDQQSFRMVDYYNPAPSGEYPLQFMEWESFNKIYDLSSTYPGLPRLITEDNTGRWRLYPHPYYNVTVKFDYDRVPQVVSAYNDTFKGLPDDFCNLVMWKALIYYGEYDEQPAVTARATKYYKTMLNRFETKFREKFHFKPHRMW